MSLKVINREEVLEKRANTKASEIIELYAGTAEANASAVDNEPVVQRNVVMTSDDWVNSPGYRMLWDEIGQTVHRIKAKMNASQVPAQGDIDDLYAKLFIDITRFRMQNVDLTSQFATEITNVNFPRTINVRELLQYRGAFERVAGSNDSVPLIEQKGGISDSLDLEIVALGWKTSLANELFNPLFSLQRVTQAMADADVDYRNSKTVGVIIGATYAAKQKVAPVTTAALTYDEKVYATLRKGIKALRALKDTGTDRLIKATEIVLLVNSADSWNLARVIRGQIQTDGGKGLSARNVGGLPISKMIEYNEGNTNGLDWGTRTLEFPGVTEGKIYMIVPKATFWVAKKLGLTVETGMGSVLQLSRKETVNYRVQGEYYKPFLGSSFPGSTKEGYGYIVEVTLPPDA